MTRKATFRLFKVEIGTDFIFHEPATEKEVEDFAADDDATLKHWQWDFNPGYLTSAWNAVQIERVVAAAVKDDEKADRYVSKGQIKREFLEIILAEQLERWRGDWKLFQPRWWEAKGRIETKHEAVARGKLMLYMRRMNSKNINAQNRKYLYRRTTLEAVIALKEAENADDLPTWIRLLELLDYLEGEGMSEEEEKPCMIKGQKIKTFKIKLCVWREASVAKYMNIRTEEIGRRPAPKGLPRSLYDSKWLASQSPKQLMELEVSEDVFALFVAATDRPYRLVPLGILTQEEKDTLPVSISLQTASSLPILTHNLQSTSHFHGIVRNDTGVFLVFNANRNALLGIPPRPASRSNDVPYTTTWTHTTACYLACTPLFPVYSGALLHALDVSIRSLPMCSQVQGQETRWALTPTLVKKWTDLEKLLISVLDCLSFQASEIKPKPYCPKASSPTLYGYNSSYLDQSELVRAASRSRDAFMPLFASVAMHFVLLDGSLQRDTWRSELIRKARLQYRLMDSLDEAVELVLQCPAGMIIDTSEGMVQELGWLFSLLLSGEAKIHVPVYFFLGEDSQSAANRASWLESYPFMRHIAAYVQSDVGSLANLPPSPVKMTEYVYIKSTFRRWGVLPNPDYLAAVEPEPQLPPVELYSGQKEGQSYAEFFARREERNAKIIAAASDKDRQKYTSRLEASKKQQCPSSKKGARVFMWEEVNGFWVRKALIRSEVEDEWYEFAPSQRSFDPVKNEWDLCKPLDSKADVPDNGEYDDDDDDYMGDWIDPTPPVGPSAPPSAPVSSAPPSSLPSAPPPSAPLSAPPSAPAPSTAAPSTTVQSTDGNVHEPPPTLQHVDSYYEEHEDGDVYDRMNREIIAFTVKNTLESRFGFVNAPDVTFLPAELARADHAARVLGDRTQTADTLGHAALALVHSVLKTKKLQEMPAHLFDLRDDDAVQEIRKNSGITIEIAKRNGVPTHLSTAYLLTPHRESSRMIVVYSAATAMQLIRLQCASWPEIITQLHALGAPFNIALRRCASHGVRPEEYVPDRHDWRRYIILLEKFLLSPRGRLALQAGGVVARLARLVIQDSRLELTAEDVDVETAEEHVKNGETSIFCHRLTGAEEDLILGVYSIKMNQLNHIDPSGHQEKRVSWWPQAGAFFNSELNVGWWTQDCENWFQEILDQFRKGTAELLNNARWGRRIRGYNAALKASKNLDAVHADFLSSPPSLF
ncbi:hypothetical protein R3P38DRAFT_2502236 [Favolaschia claudopus]|uniref:Uncharacterized protein n=1 Tax=Favolaschia claudopus TaxID=2862362 RepID=A0AAW0DFV0_9AGAR